MSDSESSISNQSKATDEQIIHKSDSDEKEKTKIIETNLSKESLDSDDDDSNVEKVNENVFDNEKNDKDDSDDDNTDKSSDNDNPDKSSDNDNADKSSDNDNADKSSDNETSEQTNLTNVNVASLFGDDVSSSESEQSEKSKEKSFNDEDSKIVGPILYSDPDEEQEDREEPVLITRMDLEMARCRANLGREGALFVKFPNFLSVETKPFDQETYEDEIEDDEVLDEEGRTRLKLRIENTIRWRHAKNPTEKAKYESNAKIVKWSDGSMSLYLGSEIFDVEKQKVMDHNHLFIRQGAALQAQTVFTEKLVFRPHSTETMTHRKMTLNMADKSNKTQKVKVIASVGDNPETQKLELIRKEEERLRASARRESQQRRTRERPRYSGISSSFVEGNDSGDDSVSMIKKSYHQNSRNFDNFGSSSGEDEHDMNKSKKFGDSKIDSDDSETSNNKDSSRHKQNVKRKIVIDEEDD